MNDLFREESIEITWGIGRRRVGRAFVFGEFAVHRRVRCPSLWQITHLPTGSALANVAGCFRTRKQACAAVEQIQSLKNTWAFVDEGDLLSLRSAVEEICLSHGGKYSAEGGYTPPLNALNGYGA